MVKSYLSNPLQFVDGTFVLNVAGIKCSGRFEQYNPAFFIRHGTVFHSAWHYYELAFFDPFMAVAKLHAEASFDHQEHLVLVLVVVKYEPAVELDELDVLSVELGGDAR